MPTCQSAVRRPTTTPARAVRRGVRLGRRRAAEQRGDGLASGSRFALDLREHGVGLADEFRGGLDGRDMRLDGGPDLVGDGAAVAVGAADCPLTPADPLADAPEPANAKQLFSLK